MKIIGKLLITSCCGEADSGKKVRGNSFSGLKWMKEQKMTLLYQHDFLSEDRDFFFLRPPISVELIRKG